MNLIKNDKKDDGQKNKLPKFKLNNTHLYSAAGVGLVVLTIFGKVIIVTTLLSLIGYTAGRITKKMRRTV